MAQGFHEFIHEKCLESAGKKFIVSCIHCGNAYSRPKTLVIKRLLDFGLKPACEKCMDERIVEGIGCFTCDPDAIV